MEAFVALRLSLTMQIVHNYLSKELIMIKKILIMVAIAGLAPAAGTIQAQEATPFGDALNKCLAVAVESFSECAHIAGSIAGSDKVRVRQEFDFANPRKTRGLESDNCKIRPDGSEYCEVFSCGSDNSNLQSVCNLVGHCVFLPSSGSTATCDF